MRWRKEMSIASPTKIIPLKKPIEIFKVDGSPHYVAPGETVEILVDCVKPFTVFFPYFGLFDVTCQEAEDASSWTGDTFKHQWWGVRVTRKVPLGESPIDKMPYCIYSKDLNCFAEGNSPPEMGLKP
jgi:hypothetical protein